MGTLVEFARFRPAPTTTRQEPDAGRPMLLNFPTHVTDSFMLEMGHTLARFARPVFGLRVSRFGVDESGANVCQFRNGLTVGRARRRRLFVTDPKSGFTDFGPFASMYEICQVISWLEA